MKKHLLIIFLPFILVNTASAQVAMAVAKQEDYPFSQLEYRVEWGYGNRWDAEMHCMKYLEDKGYKKVISPLLYNERAKLTKGFWVVIKTERLEDRKQKVTFSLGASADSQADAEKNAVENLAKNDWNWKSLHGYSVDKSGIFDEVPQKQLIYIIRSRKTACGDDDYAVSYTLYMYSNSLYQGMYNFFKKINKEDNTTISIVRHIIRDNGIVGILKCKQRCSDSSIRTLVKVIERNTEAEIKQQAPYDATTVSDIGETKYFVDAIVGLSLPEKTSFVEETKALMRKFIFNLLGEPKQKEYLQRSVAIGIRG